MRICPLCRKKYEGAETRFCPNDGQPLVADASGTTQPQTGALPGERVAAPFSGSLAMGLFPHQFLDAVPDSYRTPPCQPSNVKVDNQRFYEHLPVIAFWHLRENGCIRLTPVVKAGDFFVDLLQSYTTYAIEINRANQTPLPGLEHDFLEIIKGCEPGTTTDDVLMWFLGAKARSVGGRFSGRLEEWLISLGYGRRKPPDTSPKPFFSMPKGNNSLYGEDFIPVCERIGAQERAAQMLQRGWLRFRAEEGETFNHLYKDVRRAIAKRSLGGAG